MITLHKYEGKNKDLLKEECIKELNDAYMITSEIESGIFKGKKYVLEAITNEEIINYIRMFINDLSKKMNIEINSEIKIVDKNINVLLVSNNNNILIGKDGKTLNAIQLILRQFCKQLNKFDFKIMVDASNYKAKKIKKLEYEIKQGKITSKEAKKFLAGHMGYIKYANVNNLTEKLFYMKKNL